MFTVLDTNLWCNYKTHGVYFPHTSKIRESSCLSSLVFLPFMYYLFYQNYFVKEKSFDLVAVKFIQIEICSPEHRDLNSWLEGHSITTWTR